MSRPLYLGVDPGKRGGVCLLDAAGQIVLLRPMPTCLKPEGARAAKRGDAANSEVDVATLADWLRPHYHAIVAVQVEEASMRRGQSSRDNASTHQGYGRLTGALDALGLRVLVVRSTDWKLAMGVSRKKLPGASKSRHTARLKAVALARAAELWPEQSWLRTPGCTKPHDGLAEAALIAEHLRRQHG